MFLNQIAMQPLVIDFKNMRFEVPKFTNEDWIKWGDELDRLRLERATKDLDPQQKFKMLTFYNLLPTDVSELKSWVDTPRGRTRVIKECLQRAMQIGTIKGEEYEPIVPPKPITKEVILEILTKGVPTELTLLARELADIRDKSKLTPDQQQEQDDKSKEAEGTLDDEQKPATGDQEDPLADLSGLGLKI